MVNSKRSATPTSEIPSHTSAQVSDHTSQAEILLLSSQYEPRTSPESPEFLGLTSFSATVQQGSLAEEPQVVSDPSFGINVEMPANLRLGVHILIQLPREESCHDLLEWYLDNVVVMGAYKLSRRLALKALWLTYGNVLRGERSEADLETIAKQFLQNGRIPLKKIDDPMEWIGSFSGVNAR